MANHREFSLVWSIVVAAFSGLFGLTTLSTAFGMYMEAPPPLLGFPFVDQTLQTCNAQGQYRVCPPVVINDPGIAIFDFGIFFVIGFAIASMILYASSGWTSHSSLFKRNIAPVVLLAITILLVSLSVNGAISSGASLTQPHWPTPSGVTFGLGNFTLYSGSATTSSSQGAHIDLRVMNFHWTNQTIVLSNIVLWSNGTKFSPVVYLCKSTTSCEASSNVVMPPYTSTVIRYYLGSSIQSGAQYSYNFTITSDLSGPVIATSPPILTAQ